MADRAVSQTPTDSWKQVFYCLAAAVLAVGVKNYLLFLVHDTALCEYLCPSIFGDEELQWPVLLGRLFAFQRWIEETIQTGFDALWRDQVRLVNTLVVAPLIEEGMYRGPLFLSKKYSRRWLWWMAAITLTLAFVLSHGRIDLSSLPLLVLGIGSAWLVMKTQRFWPSLALHGLFNFYFASDNLCRSLFW